MEKNCILYITVLAIFSSAPLIAQSNNFPQGDDEMNQPGMETRKINNDVTLLIPEGGRMHRRNETTYVAEGPEEYAARKFEDVYGRLKKLENENKELAEQIRYLKSKLILPEKSPDKDVQKIAEE
ncbi:MAG: hypothetical protein WC522_06970 [Candidatus Omnitrophota bacterium]